MQRLFTINRYAMDKNHFNKSCRELNSIHARKRVLYFSSKFMELSAKEIFNKNGSKPTFSRVF